MLIENPELFKNWCTKILEPICDADPEALAKYVYALVKKDKPIETLREEILDQLDVFLQNETKDFVDQLFGSLETNEYMKVLECGDNVIGTNKELDSPLIDLKPLIDDEFGDIKLPPVSISVPDTSLQFNRIKPIIQVSTLPNLSDSLIGDDKENLQQADSDRSRTVKDRGKVSGNRHRGSRSRSKERSRRSRSRERKEARGATGTLGASKLYKSRSPRRYEKRRSRSTSPVVSRYRSRSKSPRATGYRGRYRNRSYSKSKSPTNESRSNLKRSRSPTPPSSTDHNTVDSKSLYTSDGKKKRCRDYETRGFCVRGDLCQYDHGLDAVVIANPSVLGFGSNSLPGLNDEALMSSMILSNPQRFPIRLAPPEYNPASPGMWQRNLFRTAPPRGPQQLLLNAPPPPFQSATAAPGMMQRELINVPVLDSAAPVVSSTDSVSNTLLPPLIGPYQYPPPTSASQMHDSAPSVYKPMFYGPNVPLKKKNFDFNRLGPKKYSTNCSLELKKIPIHLNNISQLNNHFAKFGKIVNIQVSYEGDPESALITFSSHNEANFAYKSTEPILNNRFIKVFWHKGNETKPDTLRPEENQQSTTAEETSSLKSENAPATINDAPVVPQTTSAVETVPTTTTSLAKSSDRVMKINNMKCVRKAVVDVEKSNDNDPNKLRKDLNKRKQILLDKQLEQQKLLVSRLEKQDLSDAQRQTVMETIKTLHDSIDVLRKDLMAEISEQIALNGKSTEQTQKEVLDVELELITKQKEGQDTTNLQKKLNQLKLQAGILLNRKPSTLPSTKFVKNASSYASNTVAKKPIRFPNRAALSKNNVNPKKVLVMKRSKYVLQKSTVDNRPSKLLISGFELDDCDAVISHFKHFGPIEEHMIDLTTPSLILHYKNRKDAEAALINGKMFEDRILSIIWLSAVHAQLTHLKKLLQNSSKKIAKDTKPDLTTLSALVPKNEPDSDVQKTNVDIENNDMLIKQESFNNDDSEEMIKTENVPIVDGNHFLEDILLNDDDDIGNEDKSWKHEYLSK